MLFFLMVVSQLVSNRLAVARIVSPGSFQETPWVAVASAVQGRTQLQALGLVTGEAIVWRVCVPRQSLEHSCKGRGVCQYAPVCASVAEEDGSRATDETTGLNAEWVGTRWEQLLAGCYDSASSAPNSVQVVVRIQPSSLGGCRRRRGIRRAWPRVLALMLVIFITFLAFAIIVLGKLVGKNMMAFKGWRLARSLLLVCAGVEQNPGPSGQAVPASWCPRELEVPYVPEFLRQHSPMMTEGEYRDFELANWDGVMEPTSAYSDRPHGTITPLRESMHEPSLRLPGSHESNNRNDDDFYTYAPSPRENSEDHLRSSTQLSFILTREEWSPDPYPVTERSLSPMAGAGVIRTLLVRGGVEPNPGPSRDKCGGASLVPFLRRLIVGEYFRIKVNVNGAPTTYLCCLEEERMSAGTPHFVVNLWTATGWSSLILPGTQNIINVQTIRQYPPAELPEGYHCIAHLTNRDAVLAKIGRIPEAPAPCPVVPPPILQLPQEAAQLLSQRIVGEYFRMHTMLGSTSQVHLCCYEGQSLVAGDRVLFHIRVKGGDGTNMWTCEYLPSNRQVVELSPVATYPPREIQCTADECELYLQHRDNVLGVVSARRETSVAGPGIGAHTVPAQTLPSVVAVPTSAAPNAPVSHHPSHAAAAVRPGIGHRAQQCHNAAGPPSNPFLEGMVSAMHMQPPTVEWERAAMPSRVADYRLPIALVSMLTKEQRTPWRTGLSTIMAGLEDASVDNRVAKLLAVAYTPSKILAQTGGRAADRRIRAFTEESVLEMEAPPRRETKGSDPERRLLNRAVALAGRGLLSKAVKVLMRELESPVPEAEIVTQLAAMHPQRTEIIAPCTVPNRIELVVPRTAKGEVRTLKQFVAGLCGDKRGGPLGWTEELMRDALEPSREGEWMAFLCDIANGTLSEAVAQVLTRAMLRGIPKDGGKVRPLTMGEVFVKVAAKLLLSMDKVLTSGDIVGNYQYAFQSCGTEVIIHKVRHYLSTVDGGHAVLVDCRNAYNAVRRKAIRDALEAEPRLAALRGFFNQFYVRESELVVCVDGEDCPVLFSSEGVRQGDVLGPLFFCIALKGAMDRVLARYAQAYPGAELTVLCYMDDITVLGTEETLGRVMPILTEELAALSLLINPDKTVTTSRWLAQGLECKESDCVKLLGAMVGRVRDKEGELLGKEVEKHELFFNRVIQLPAEIAMRLLVKCGNAKWAYVVRTHPPEAAESASRAFTDMMLQAVAIVLKIPYESIDDDMRTQLLLPIRFGGQGLTDWVAFGREAYAASLARRRRTAADYDPMTPDESVRVDSYWEGVLAKIQAERPDLFAHLKRFRTKMANAWLDSPLTSCSVHASLQFIGGVLFRLRWAGAAPDAPTAFKCRCGFPTQNVAATTNRDMVLHMTGCTRCGGAQKRHHALNGVLANVLDQAGFVTAPEVPFVVEQASQEERDRIMDIVAYPPDGGPPLFIDSTIANTVGRTLIGRPVPKTLAAKVAEKRERYKLLLEQEGAEFLVVAVDVFGRMDKATEGFLQHLTGMLRNRCVDEEEKSEATYAATISRISRAIAFGNGACLLLSHRMMRLGLQLGGVRRYVSVGGVCASGDSDNAVRASQGADGGEVSALRQEAVDVAEGGAVVDEDSPVEELFVAPGCE